MLKQVNAAVCSLFRVKSVLDVMILRLLTLPCLP